MKRLDELSLNVLGKVFLTAVAAWVAGKATNLKVRGTPREVKAVANALQSTKLFQEELHKSEASVQSVMDRLHEKQVCARDFERVIGIEWPL